MSALELLASTPFSPEQPLPDPTLPQTTQTHLNLILDGNPQSDTNYRLFDRKVNATDKDGKPVLDEKGKRVTTRVPRVREVGGITVTETGQQLSRDQVTAISMVSASGERVPVVNVLKDNLDIFVDEKIFDTKYLRFAKEDPSKGITAEEGKDEEGKLDPTKMLTKPRSDGRPPIVSRVQENGVVSYAVSEDPADRVQFIAALFYGTNRLGADAAAVKLAQIGIPMDVAMTCLQEAALQYADQVLQAEQQKIVDAKNAELKAVHDTALDEHNRQKITAQEAIEATTKRLRRSATKTKLAQDINSSFHRTHATEALPTTLIDMGNLQLGEQRESMRNVNEHTALPAVSIAVFEGKGEDAELKIVTKHHLNNADFNGILGEYLQQGETEAYAGLADSLIETFATLPPNRNDEKLSTNTPTKAEIVYRLRYLAQQRQITYDANGNAVENPKLKAIEEYFQQNGPGDYQNLPPEHFKQFLADLIPVQQTQQQLTTDADTYFDAKDNTPEQQQARKIFDATRSQILDQLHDVRTIFFGEEKLQATVKHDFEVASLLRTLLPPKERMRLLNLQTEVAQRRENSSSKAPYDAETQKIQTIREKLTKAQKDGSGPTKAEIEAIQQELQATITQVSPERRRLGELIGFDMSTEVDGKKPLQQLRDQVQTERSAILKALTVQDHQGNTVGAGAPADDEDVLVAEIRARAKKLGVMQVEGESYKPQKLLDVNIQATKDLLSEIGINLEEIKNAAGTESLEEAVAYYLGADFLKIKDKPAITTEIILQQFGIKEGDSNYDLIKRALSEGRTIARGISHTYPNYADRTLAGTDLDMGLKGLNKLYENGTIVETGDPRPPEIPAVPPPPELQLIDTPQTKIDATVPAWQVVQADNSLQILAEGSAPRRRTRKDPTPLVAPLATPSDSESNGEDIVGLAATEDAPPEPIATTTELTVSIPDDEIIPGGTEAQNGAVPTEDSADKFIVKPDKFILRKSIARPSLPPKNTILVPPIYTSNRENLLAPLPDNLELTRTDSVQTPPSQLEAADDTTPRFGEVTPDLPSPENVLPTEIPTTVQPMPPDEQASQAEIRIISSTEPQAQTEAQKSIKWPGRNDLKSRLRQRLQLGSSPQSHANKAPGQNETESAIPTSVPMGTVKEDALQEVAHTAAGPLQAVIDTLAARAATLSATGPNNSPAAETQTNIKLPDAEPEDNVPVDLTPSIGAAPLMQTSQDETPPAPQVVVSGANDLILNAPSIQSDSIPTDQNTTAAANPLGIADATTTTANEPPPSTMTDKATITSEPEPLGEPVTEDDVVEVSTDITPPVPEVIGTEYALDPQLVEQEQKAGAERQTKAEAIETLQKLAELENNPKEASRMVTELIAKSLTRGQDQTRAVLAEMLEAQPENLYNAQQQYLVDQLSMFVKEQMPKLTRDMVIPDACLVLAQDPGLLQVFSRRLIAQVNLPIADHLSVSQMGVERYRAEQLQTEVAAYQAIQSNNKMKNRILEIFHTFVITRSGKIIPSITDNAIGEVLSAVKPSELPKRFQVNDIDNYRSFVKTNAELSANISKYATNIGTILEAERKTTVVDTRYGDIVETNYDTMTGEYRFIATDGVTIGSIMSDSRVDLTQQSQAHITNVEPKGGVRVSENSLAHIEQLAGTIWLSKATAYVDSVKSSAAINLFRDATLFINHPEGSEQLNQTVTESPDVYYLQLPAVNTLEASSTQQAYQVHTIDGKRVVTITAQNNAGKTALLIFAEETIIGSDSPKLVFKASELLTDKITLQKRNELLEKTYPGAMLQTAELSLSDTSPGIELSPEQAAATIENTLPGQYDRIKDNTTIGGTRHVHIQVVDAQLNTIENAAVIIQNVALGGLVVASDYSTISVATSESTIKVKGSANMYIGKASSFVDLEDAATLHIKEVGNGEVLQISNTASGFIENPKDLSKLKVSSSGTVFINRPSELPDGTQYFSLDLPSISTIQSSIGDNYEVHTVEERQFVVVKAHNAANQEAAAIFVLQKLSDSSKPVLVYKGAVIPTTDEKNLNLLLASIAERIHDQIPPITIESALPSDRTLLSAAVPSVTPADTAAFAPSAQAEAAVPNVDVPPELPQEPVLEVITDRTTIAKRLDLTEDEVNNALKNTDHYTEKMDVAVRLVNNELHLTFSSSSTGKEKSSRIKRIINSLVNKIKKTRPISVKLVLTSEDGIDLNGYDYHNKETINTIAVARNLSLSQIDIQEITEANNVTVTDNSSVARIIHGTNIAVNKGSVQQIDSCQTAVINNGKTIVGVTSETTIDIGDNAVVLSIGASNAQIHIVGEGGTSLFLSTESDMPTFVRSITDTPPLARDTPLPKPTYYQPVVFEQNNIKYALIRTNINPPRKGPNNANIYRVYALVQVIPPVEGSSSGAPHLSLISYIDENTVSFDVGNTKLTFA